MVKAPRTHSPFEVLRAFVKLGVSSFGGPIAHIGYFREEFVVRRRWLDEETYADLVGLCQFLPGPASSQVGFTLGLMRAGYRGALAASSSAPRIVDVVVMPGSGPVRLIAFVAKAPGTAIVRIDDDRGNSRNVRVIVAAAIPNRPGPNPKPGTPP